MPRYLIIFIGFLFFFSNFCFSQKPDIRLRHISASDGLSNSYIRSILQDHKGFMWFASADGLNRYDGNSIVVYKNDPTNKSSLINNDTYALLEDSNKNLWIGTQNGLDLFDREKDEFIHVKEVGAGYISLIYGDNQNSVWVKRDEVLYKYNSSLKTFISHSFSGKEKDFICLYKDRSGRFWAGSWAGIYLLDEERHEATFQSQIKINYVSCIFEDRKKRLWIGSLNGLSRYDRENNQIYNYKHDPRDPSSLSKNFITNINEDAEGRILIGTENGGLNVYNEEKDNFYHYKNDETDNESLSFNTINCIYKDKNNGIWLGSYSAGVELIKKSKFVEFKKRQSEANSLSHNNVLCFAEDHDGNIWIGTDGGGLNLFNKKEGTFKNFTHDPANPKSIGGNIVTYLKVDKENNLWIGHWDVGISKYIKDKNEFINIKRDESKSGETLVNNNIINIYEDKKGNFWISCTWAFQLFDRSTNKFYHFNTPDGSLKNYVGDVFEDSYGNFWVGTWDGLNLMNRETKKMTNFSLIGKDSSSLDNNKIFTLFEDSKKNFWIGTSGGLYLLNREKMSFTVYGKSDGLPCNTIYGIVEDAKGNLWLSTTSGISVFDPIKKTALNFDHRDGLQSNDFKENAFLKLSSGEILFGGPKGFNIVNTESLNENKVAPDVAITGFKLFNKSVPIGGDSPLQKHISETKEIILSYKQSVLSFEFAALSYDSPEKNQFAYILEGFEKDWNYVGNNRNAAYMNLAPGKYTFRVKACNNDGVWNEAGTELKITITPPFWATWWFKSFTLIGAIAAVAGFVKLRINIIKRQKDHLEQEVKERTQKLSEANLELSEQKAELTSKAEELKAQAEELKSQSEKLYLAYEENKIQDQKLRQVHKEIKDSIKAAQDIQRAILPPRAYIARHLPEHFILNLPKDVVSGDFYWFEEHADKIVLAAVDCTGHGVSGAFMSINAHHLLNQAIHPYGNLVASEILDRLNGGLIRELHQIDTETLNTSGMDISLCILDKNKKNLQFAGANNPLYLIRNGELTEIKGSRCSIGLINRIRSPQFKNNELELEKGDIVYIFSDGYADQISYSGEKFMYHQFRSLLKRISSEPMSLQEKILQETLSNWRGEYEQLDDVLVIGFKI